MSRIHVDRFSGIAPKLGDTALGDRQASKAVNTKLWSKKVRAFSANIPVEAIVKTGDIQTIYLYNGGNDWLAWTQDVNAVPGPIAGDLLEKLYFTGTDKPRVTTNGLFDDGLVGTFRPPDSFILGIPAPTSAPVATDNAAGNINATATWVFTFVRKYSDNTIEESAPSPVSNSLSLTNRQASVTLPDGSMATPGDYGITHKRLYRNEGSGYFFVSEVTFATASTIDNVATASLGDLIETTNYLPPPDGMVGLIALPNGILAGFKTNEIFLSDPYRPHAYPLVNRYAVNWPIVGLGVVGTSIVAITTAYPSIGRGVDPAAYSFKRHPGLFPGTAKRGIASANVGVLWPTPNGLALSDGVNVVNVTQDLFTREVWSRDFFPTTIHSQFHDGRYYAWFANGLVDGAGVKLGGGFIFDPSEEASLVNMSEYIYAAYNVPKDDKLFVLKKNPETANANHVYEWDVDPSHPLVYEWKSKVFISNGLENFAFAQLIADFDAGLSPEEVAALEAQLAAIISFNNAQPDTDGPVNGNASMDDQHGFAVNVAPVNADTYLLDPLLLDFISGSISFRYWADGTLVLEANVSTKEPLPLPAGIMSEKHQFEVNGSVAVSQVTLATSAEELATV